MTGLWLALAALCLLALAFFAWPLWRYYRASQMDQAAMADRTDQLAERLQANVALFREHLQEFDQALSDGRIDRYQFDQLKREQERGLLDDERALRRAQRHSSANPRLGLALLLIVALSLPVGAFWLYTVLGSAPDVYLAKLQTQKNEQDYLAFTQQKQPDPARTRALVEYLETRVAAQPDNLQYWIMLARNRMELGDYREAVSAYREVLRLDPESALVRAELAQALYFVQDNRMTREIGEMALEALERDATNTTALSLAGIYAFEQSDYRAAADYWQQAAQLSNPHSSTYAALQAGIERALSRLGETPEQTPAGEEAPEAAAEGGARLQVTVSLGSQIDAQPDQVVYVYARAWQGPPMPLAIARLTASELPTRVTLDDTSAMTRANTLSSADSVELVARLSLSGDPTPAPGDWQATLGPVDPEDPAEDLQLVIDEPITN